MVNVLPLVSLVAGIGAGTLAFRSSRRQPDMARSLQTMACFFFGIATSMALLLLS